MHVGTPDADVVAEMRERCVRARNNGADLSDDDEAEIVIAALKRHRENRGVYDAVVTGRL
jgi:hypothetical protein